MSGVALCSHRNNELLGWSVWVYLNEISYVGDRSWCCWEAVFSILNPEMRERGLPLVTICPVTCALPTVTEWSFPQYCERHWHFSCMFHLTLKDLVCCLSNIRNTKTIILLLQNNFTFRVIIKPPRNWKKCPDVGTFETTVGDSTSSISKKLRLVTHPSHLLYGMWSKWLNRWLFLIAWINFCS